MKKPNPCSPCNPCLNFCPSPKADGHYYLLIYSFCVSHWYIHSVLPLCPRPSAWTLIKKRNTDTTDLTRIGLSRIFFFDIIWLMILGFGYGFIWICECWHTLFPSSTGFWSFVVNNKTKSVSVSNKGTNRVCQIGEKWATSVQQPCPSGVTCLPMMGNVLAHVGQRACPKWADLLSEVCPIS